MSDQHEPTAGETSSSVSVRRAVSVPPPDQEPGADLGPRTPDAAAPDPITPDPTAAGVNEPTAPSGPATMSAEPATGAPESAATATVTASTPEGPARRRFFGLRSRSESTGPAPEPGAGPEPSSAAEEPDNDGRSGLLFASDHDHPDDPSPDEAGPGRPHGPMIAAAALAGAVLIGVPIVAIFGPDDDSRTEQWVSSKPVGGEPLEPNMSDDKPPADYVAESPSPTASPTAGKKTAPEPVAEVKKVPVADTELAPAKAESAAPGKKAAEPAPPTPRQLANALSNKANVMLKNQRTGLCVDVPGEDAQKPAIPLKQGTCRATTADNQLYDLKVVDKDGGPQGSSLFVIKNRKSGLCLDLASYKAVTPGSKIMEYHCNGTTADNQLWWLDPNKHGNRIRNAVSNNLCMGVAGGDGSKLDAALQLQTCSGKEFSSQRWMVSQL
ncbi:RICIN domain-containing protein [Streptomyces pakalii]|uniref:RICIN domain-containing protein n=1 Tax=Streptomyces pakalii TaxID=3036494 RepID=A0ABT7DAC8_9ACTN|nr:ricin-type beta-trefoil lectin domain protein [Streptomyces pakalii]MDJ1642762.1 RICIN domain-containing protein [Streptomyces pakalii]